MDGFKADIFHKMCDNRGPTLSVIKSEHDYIFGGYTEEPWYEKRESCYRKDPKAFIFSDHH
jgi:BTB/POZ domain-containing protein KCTD9